MYDNFSDTTTNSFVAIYMCLLLFIVMYWPIIVLQIVSMWKVFKKFGKPGWAAIVPGYNMYVLCEIAGKEWWYLLLFLVPVVQIYAMYVIYDGVAKKFGKSAGFAVGMILVPFVFWLILAFSKSSVVIPSAQTNEVSSMPADNTTQSAGMPVQNEVPVAPEMNNAYGAPTFEQTNIQPANDMQNFEMPVQNEAPVVSEMNNAYVAPSFEMPSMQPTTVDTMQNAQMPVQNEVSVQDIIENIDENNN